MISCTIQLISEATSQQGYIVEQLWRALERDTMDRQPLIQVATWCIGEYGDLLLYGPSSSEENPIRVRIRSGSFNGGSSYIDVSQRHGVFDIVMVEECS